MYQTKGNIATKLRKDNKSVMILTFQSDRSGQTVLTQLRLTGSESTTFAISSASFGHTLCKNLIFTSGVATIDIFCLVHSAVKFRGSCQLRWLGLGCVDHEYTHLIPDSCGCHDLRILAVAMCKIGGVCCLPASEHQPFSSNNLDLSAPKEA